jgi:hypothetical protein
MKSSKYLFKKYYATNGKLLWLKKHNFNFNEDDILIVPSATDKQKFSGKNQILVDDYAKNIKSWNAAGGIGILHKNAQDSIKQLTPYV